MSSWVWGISPNGDSTISLGNLCRCLTTLTGKKEEFSCLQMDTLTNLCPLPLVPSAGAAGKSPAPCFLMKVEKRFFPGAWAAARPGCSEHLSGQSQSSGMCGLWRSGSSALTPRWHPGERQPWPRHRHRQPRRQRAAAVQAKPGPGREPDPPALLWAGFDNSRALAGEGCVTRIVHGLRQIQTRRPLSSSLIWQTVLLWLRGLRGTWRSRTRWRQSWSLEKMLSPAGNKQQPFVQYMRLIFGSSLVSPAAFPLFREPWSMVLITTWARWVTANPNPESERSKVGQNCLNCSDSWLMNFLTCT